MTTDTKILRSLLVLSTLLSSACSGSDASRDGAPAGARADSAPPSARATRPSRGVDTTGYIGLQYDSLPGDFRYRAGAVLPPRPGKAEYDLSHVSTPTGDMVWLDTLGSPVGAGLRARIVRAELKVPPLAADERLFMASCDVGGKLDPLVVAIVVAEPGATRFTKIRQAWRVNIPSSRFDIIPVSNVSCEDPGG